MNTLKQTTLKMTLAILLIGATLLFALGQTRPAYAATITVDDMPCTLANAIAAANLSDGGTVGGCTGGPGADTINLETNVCLGPFPEECLDNALPPITSEIILKANGHTLDGTNTFRLLEIYPGGNLTLNNATITGGIANNGGGIANYSGMVTVNGSTLKGNQVYGGVGTYGGAIYNVGDGTVTVNNSTLSGNSSDFGGGGIFNAFGGTVNLNNSTLSANTAEYGGGIENDGKLRINNSTLSDNTAFSSHGGGIYNVGTVNLNRSLLSGNSAVLSGAEVYNQGNVVANNFNLFGHNDLTNVQAFVNFTPGGNDRTATSDGTNPQAIDNILDPLSDNGGPTFTHALISGSVAIDTAPNADCQAPPINSVDQRGEARNMDGNGMSSANECDTGSFEYASGTVADCAAVTQVPQAECEVLLVLYNSTDGANWTNHTHWLDFGGNAPCDWYGVICTAGHVTFLQLDRNQLSGRIPSELGNLTHLNTLGLNSNQLSGFIPLELGNLTHLTYLGLAGNQLSGRIPPELGNLTHLSTLSLSSNQLSGRIPPELGNLTHLTFLGLHINQLSGSIPPELGNLANLKKLILMENNALSGSLPLRLVDLTNLSTFYFNNTSLCEPANELFQIWLNNIPNLLSTEVICG